MLAIWYAAPTLVHHYVSVHEYSPPADFVDAVLSPVAIGIDHGWFPEAEALLRENRRTKRRT